MPPPDKIIIIGGGIVELVDQKYAGRSQIIEYLGEFKTHYSSVIWVTSLAKTKNYKTFISEETNIELNIINTDGCPVLSPKGLWFLLKSYIKFTWQLDNSTDVIVNGLSLTIFPYLLLARLFGRNSLYYLGSDPKLTQELRKTTFYGRILSFLNRFALPIILKCPNYVLVRGRSTLEQCQRWNKNTTPSNPLISYKQLRNTHTYNHSRPQNNLFKILYVGKLERNKGVHILLEALASLSTNKPVSFVLDIVGNGIMEEKLRHMAKSYNLTAHVVFHGFLDDVVKLTTLFSTSNCLILPTVYHEGFPRVIDEAMACGLPIICSRLGGMKDGLSEEEVLFIEPGSSKDLTSAINRIINDSKYRNKLQQASKSRAKSILKQTAAEQHIMLLTN